MVHLPRQASDEEILAILNAWIELLAQGEDEAAFQMFCYAPDTHWSPKLIRTVITNYGFIEPLKDGSSYQVTSLTQTQGQPFHEVDWWEPDSNTPARCVGIVLYTMPLNGIWSDVTADFTIIETDGELALELNDIHVL